MTEPRLNAIILGCSLKPSPAESSAEVLASQLLTELKTHNVDGSIIRAVDFNIKPGVSTDEGKGDDWPRIRKQILDADIVIIATPTWAGHMSSVAQSVIERLDAELSETDSEGRPSMYGKVAGAVVVGNEDGAHKICADIFQSLNDYGFTIPAQCGTYWNGEAMQTTDYKELDSTPEQVASSNKSVAANLAHASRLLKQSNYPV